jgi:hypothetical protein
MNAATLRVIKRPDTVATLTGIEVEHMNERDSGFALLEHFGIPDHVPAEPSPELILQPTEQDGIRYVMRSKKDGGVGR